MLLQVLILLLSFVILYFGAEWTLNSAEKVGEYFDLSPLVIGLLIIGFGTSLPELFVSHIAVMSGHPEIALGNVVGSNVANLFLILGLSGIFVPLHVYKIEFRQQIFFHLALTAGLAVVLSMDFLTPWSTLGLSIFFIFYIYMSYKKMAEQRVKVPTKIGLVEIPPKSKRKPVSLAEFFKLLMGFTLLWAGGKLLVESGSKLGLMWGLSEYVISAVIVALGTSFPELVTAFFACYKKKDTDLILGNIIGSNVFNVAFVLGSLGFYNIELKPDFKIELILLFIGSFVLLGLAVKKMNFFRVTGVFFLLCYLGMVCYWL
ncbi:MAG: calcium/sodium antiporter [Deltaproteobacteria bacterium]|nr:MAG: calcium/sodium antiporter [Deltaproteobacteria bacterium]